MRCVDCKFHKAFPTTNIHWCEATKKHRRISDEDAYVDAPCKVADRKTEPTCSKTEQVDKDINVRSKTKPQKDCFLCKWLGEVDVCGRCRNRNLFAEADTEPKPKTEPQTEKPKIRKRIDKPFRAVWLDDEHKEIGTTQTERAETMSCQECKWWFTDSLKHGGYCQSLLYNHECRYEPEVDCSWK